MVFLHTKNCIFMCVIVLATFAASLASASSPVLAMGKGFTVSQDDIDSFQRLHATMSFRSTEEEYVRVTVQLKMFALEADYLDLTPIRRDSTKRQGSSGQVEENDEFESWEVVASQVKALMHDEADIPVDFIMLAVKAEAFIAHQLEAYPIDDIVIESYYFSTPNFFTGYLDDGVPARPLDLELKQEIRKKILTTIRLKIVDQLDDQLKEKYDVRFL